MDTSGRLLALAMLPSNKHDVDAARARLAACDRAGVAIAAALDLKG